MNQTAPSETPTAAPSADFVTFGAVHLNITDADQSLDFWRDRVGLQLRGEEQGALHLGTDEETLLVLHPGGDAAVQLIDRRRLHADEHLAGTRRAGVVDVCKHRGGAFLSKGDGLHGVLRSWWWCSCGITWTLADHCV